MRIYRIFLSSPSDCAEERTTVHRVVQSLNDDPLVNTFIHIELVAWDWGAGVPLDALVSPQTSVNRHLPTPEDCDLFFGIFRYRFGTPLPSKEFRKPDGTPFFSGSEYEFHRAWESRRRGGSKPEILVYRFSGSEPCEKNEQNSRLSTFLNGSPFKEEEQWTGSVDRYETIDEFANKVNGHLRKFLSQFNPGIRPPFYVWLAQQSEHLKVNAGPRYSGNAHVENIGQIFDWLIVRQNAIEEFDESLRELWKLIITSKSQRSSMT